MRLNLGPEKSSWNRGRDLVGGPDDAGSGQPRTAHAGACKPGPALTSHWRNNEGGGRTRGEGQTEHTVLQPGKNLFQNWRWMDGWTNKQSIQSQRCPGKRGKGLYFPLITRKILSQHYTSQFSKKGLIMFLCGSARYLGQANLTHPPHSILTAFRGVLRTDAGEGGLGWGSVWPSGSQRVMCLCQLRNGMAHTRLLLSITAATSLGRDEFGVSGLISFVDTCASLTTRTMISGSRLLHTDFL